MMKKVWFYIVMYFITFTLMLVGAEILLRLTGVAETWSILAENEPAMFESDTVLGWRAKPGRYILSSFAPEGHETHYTILDDGSRATSDFTDDRSYDLIFIGGSFTEGFAVSDEDTFSWQLQKKFPSVKIGNFGVGGYGTYQSLLLLRALYKHNKPKIIIYGFLPFHEERNIANSAWLRVLTEFSKRGHSLLPFCSLDENGKLVEHKPVGYPAVPFREHLALVDFAAKFYFRFIDDSETRRRKDGFEITRKLMIAMNDLAQKNGSAFYVALLEDPEKYESFFKTSGIPVIDCRLDLDGKYTVPGEGHPNEKAHEYWAKKISVFLRAQPFFRNMSERTGLNIKAFL
jgi:hypothetical protein